MASQDGNIFLVSMLLHNAANEPVQSPNELYRLRLAVFWYESLLLLCIGLAAEHQEELR